MKNLLFCFLLMSCTLPLQSQNSLSQSLGNLVSQQRTADGVILKTTYGQAEIQVYTPEIIRIRITRDVPLADFSYSVVGKPNGCPFKISEMEGALSLRTDSLRLEITTNPVRFTLSNSQGKLLVQDDTFGTNWIGNEVTTYKRLQEGEKFVGLGEKTGNLNRRGEGYTNWNTDNPGYTLNADPIYSTFPFYMGLHHGLVYGIFFDNSYKSYFNFGASNDRFSSFGADAGEMDYYLIGGADVKQVLANYAYLTGYMPLPPIWGLGMQQSRWSYFPDQEAERIVNTFRDKKIPLDVLYLDIHYMDAYKVFTWHPQRFADPRNFTAQLKKQGVHTAVIIDPGIKVEKGYPAYESGLAGQRFVKYPDGRNYTASVWPGPCHFPDFTSATSRQWWGEQYKGLIADGVEGFWNDMNEIASWGGGRTPSLVQFDWEGRGANYLKAKNLYGMLMARSTYKGTSQIMGRRPLVLTRAAFAGAQRYTAIWTGDNVASDEHMMLGCRLVNSFGLTGMPFSGVDVGGFMGNASRELFTRWLTIGTFTPFFRVHKHYDYNASEPWSYGPDAENIARNYINLRYKLLPYLYSAFYEASTTGMPINRPVMMENPTDERAWYYEYQHQYLFGPFMMVAPVESYKLSCRVFLPKGEWFDFFTGKPYAGNQEVWVESPLDKLPVYVKGGSMIPMQKPVMNTSENAGDTLYLHIYSGTGPTEFLYYEDNGTDFEYKKGEFISVKFRFDPQQKSIDLPAIAHNKNYTGKFKYIQAILHGFSNQNTKYSINGKMVETQPNKIDLLNVQKPGTAEWLNSRTFEQEVIELPAVESNQQNTINWQ